MNREIMKTTPQGESSTVSNKIVFLFPWREVSGGPIYFMNLAENLAQSRKFKIYYIDYANGVARKMGKKDSNIQWIEYEEPFALPLCDPVTLITPIYCAQHIPRLHPESKILFINWHNYCISALCDSWRFSEQELQEFLSMVHRTNAVAFLDRAHWLAQNSFIKPDNLYRFPEKYIPAVMMRPLSAAQLRQRNSNAISVAVLGRICTDKVFAVVNLIKQLDLVRTSLEKNIYVIGTGNQTEYLLNQCSNLNVKLHMTGTMQGERLENFLREKIDILFGMGLSILEGAALAIPSVVIPHNIHPFNLDKFAFLQDSSGYALGWYDTQSESLGIKMYPLQKVVDMVYGEKDQKAALGMAAYEYVKETHMSNCDAAISAIQNTSLRFSEFQRFLKGKGMLRIARIPIGKISSSFSEDCKMLDVFGIKNFFSCRINGNKREFYLMNKRQKYICAEKVDGKYRLFIFGKKMPFIKL